VTSQPGQGSCFGFEIAAPMVSDAAVAWPRPSDKLKPEWTTPSGLQPLRILVVEDNPVNRTLATRLLEKRGHAVTPAVNGLEALERMRRHEFDAVLMDIQMPEMDGVEAVRRWREEEKARGSGRLPILALTANAMTGDEERYREAGMDGFVAKPFDPQKLFTVLERQAAGRSALTP
jgi:CheY-like chemotaxis protein